MLKFVSGSSRFRICNTLSQRNSVSGKLVPARRFRNPFHYVFILLSPLWNAFTSVLLFCVSGGQQDRRGWREGEEGGKRGGGASRRRPERSWRSSFAAWSEPFSSQQSQERGRRCPLEPGHTWGPAVRSGCCLRFLEVTVPESRLSFQACVFVCVCVCVCVCAGNRSPQAGRAERAERERKVAMRLHRGAPANVSSSDLTARLDQSRITASQVGRLWRYGFSETLL